MLTAPPTAHSARCPRGPPALRQLCTTVDRRASDQRVTRTGLSRDRCPETICTSRSRAAKKVATSLQTAAFALSSTGAAVVRTMSRPARSQPTSSRWADVEVPGAVASLRRPPPDSRRANPEQRTRPPKPGGSCSLWRCRESNPGPTVQIRAFSGRSRFVVHSAWRVRATHPPTRPTSLLESLTPP